jgi:flagellar basal body-associated protein FliL
MAKRKKSRVPAPPKRVVQAPKARQTQRDPRRTRVLFLALGGLIVVAAAAVGIAVAMGGGSAADTGVSGSCVRQTFPAQGRQHVQQLGKGFKYNSTPPTSGPHFPAPAVWNVYTAPVEEFRLVHNLEHGGVVVQYGSEVPQATVAKIVAWYDQDPRGLIVAPLPPELEQEKPELRNKIALTAWTHLMTCSTFDEGPMNDFLDDYRGPQGDGPEKYPLDALQPGGT